MEFWNRLVALALVGTEQSGALPALDAGSPPVSVATLEEETTPERALLLMAGATALYRRAGWQPVPLPITPLPTCPPDTLPACSPNAATLLARSLDSRDPRPLTEWLALAARAGVRIPDELLPAVLEGLRKAPELVAVLLPVLGERGRWLARQNPAWAYARFEDGDEVWRSAPAPVRAASLCWRRGIDPERARAVLEAGWSKEPRGARAALLSALETGLSMADEPFLEDALDHPQEEVRAAAAGLLARLPASRLVQRMEERARALITWSPGRLAQTPLSRLMPRLGGGGGVLSNLLAGSLTVILPGECDPAMARDGLTVWPSPNAVERAVWLQDIVGAVPPRRWVEWTGRTPGELVQAVRHDDAWLLSPLPAWRTATERFADTDWARTFSDAWQVVYQDRLPTVIDPDKNLPFPAGGDGPAAPAPGAWLGLLPPEEVERFMLHLLSRPEAFSDEVVLTFLGPWRGIWTEAVGRAVLVRLGRALGSRHPGDGSGAYWRERLPALAGLLPPQLASETRDMLPAYAAYGGAWDSYLNRFTTILNLRYELHQEFAR